MDLSTLNSEELGKLRAYAKPPSYQLSESLGAGCYLDPPGYPTYFIQHVYTQYGNEPRRGATALIQGRVIERAQDDFDIEARERRMRRLWIAPAYDSERVRAWEEDVYRHLKNCYIDDLQQAVPLKYGRPDFIIWPVPYYNLETFHDDPRFSEQWRANEQARIRAANAEVIERYRAVATPENHAAVRRIRQYYPDAPIRHDLIAKPPTYAATWYAREAVKPSPETCPGDYGMPHPVNGSWCQFCGWKEQQA